MYPILNLTQRMVFCITSGLEIMDSYTGINLEPRKVSINQFNSFPVRPHPIRNYVILTIGIFFSFFSECPSYGTLLTPSLLHDVDVFVSLRLLVTGGSLRSFPVPS